MNSIDKLKAAIEKLETLKDESAPGPWFADPIMRGGVFITTAREIGDYPLAEVREREEAELIVTLHRTIDAQLAILRRAGEILDTSHGHAVSAIERELALADAILGDS